MNMTRGHVFLGVCLVVMTLDAGRAGAIRCVVGSVELRTTQFDAIFLGTITSVRHMRLSGPPKVCNRWPESRHCQAAIARVRVGKIWKGQPGEATTVYSHDTGRMDYGRIFKAGTKMLFMLVRDLGETEAEYLPAACGDTMPEDDARKAGILDELDTLLTYPEPTR